MISIKYEPGTSGKASTYLFWCEDCQDGVRCTRRTLGESWRQRHMDEHH